MEKTPVNNENISEAKRKLFHIEVMGKYVFHGSDGDIEEFEPRQAHNYVNGTNIPDGEPAIFAISKADYAIFLAIVNKHNCPKGSRSSAGMRDGNLKFKATEETLSQLQDSASGYVYVFNNDQFSQRREGGVEFVSFQNVTPIEKIKVTKMDLPEQIEIIE